MVNEPIKMYHPELPDAEIDVVNPQGVAVWRQSGWRTADEMPKTKSASRGASDSEEK